MHQLPALLVFSSVPLFSLLLTSIISSLLLFGGLICCSFPPSLSCGCIGALRECSLSQTLRAVLYVQDSLLTMTQAFNELISQDGVLKLREVESLAQGRTAHRCHSNFGLYGFSVRTPFLSPAAPGLPLSRAFWFPRCTIPLQEATDATSTSSDSPAAQVLDRNGPCQPSHS